MAQVTAGNLDAVDMNALMLTGLFSLATLTRGATTLTATLPSGYVVTFTGQFTYGSGGSVTGGTVSGFQVAVNGSNFYSVTGLSLSAPQFVQWVQAGNVSALYGAALAGNDDLNGGAMNDNMFGDAGHDNLFGRGGADTLTGGAGNDHLYGQSAGGGSDGADSLSGGTGNDYLQGNAGNDTLDGGDGSDRINGGGDNDQITGSTGNDTINGNLGNDTIDGGADNDSLRGGQGNDSIAGGTGNDLISGDLGADTMSGGGGTDYFLFTGAASPTSAPDRITDFTDGTDRLNVGQLPLSVLKGAAQPSLSAAATLAQQLFQNNAGTSEVAAIGVGSDTYIFYSSSRGATVDSAIQLAGINPSAISTDDFVV